MHHRALADLEAAEERHKAQAAADPQAANEAPGWTAVIDAYSRFDGVAIWIRNHRDEALKQGPELEQKFARHAQVWQELANLYRAPKERERASRAYIKLSPDFWAYQRLTQMLKAQKRMDEWKATIDDFLAQPEAGLTHAQMRVEVANYYMDRSEWKEAEPYAAAAAETWAEWAILCAIRCYQGLGDVEQESLWRSRVVGRYPNPRNWLEWYVHCQNRRRPPATTSQAAIHQPPMTSGASVFDPSAVGQRQTGYSGTPILLGSGSARWSSGSLATSFEAVGLFGPYDDRLGEGLPRCRKLQDQPPASSIAAGFG